MRGADVDAKLVAHSVLSPIHPNGYGAIVVSGPASSWDPGRTRRQRLTSTLCPRTITRHDFNLMGTSGNAFRTQCIEKVRRLHALGIDPYPSTSRRSHLALELHDRFDGLEGTVVTVAGRMMSRRGHGQLTFADVQDHSGRIQLMIASENLKPG